MLPGDLLTRFTDESLAAEAITSLADLGLLFTLRERAKEDGLELGTFAALAVQRYAEDIGGGSELHARYIAEHLAAHADVHVLTTCARDYVSWKNEYPAGETRVNGIAVERFAVARERDPRDFARRSSLVFDETHSIADELAWLDSQGPVSPALIARDLQAAQFGEHFLRGLLADVAGVEDDHGGIGRRLRRAIAQGRQDVRHAGGIVHVHLAAIGLDIELLRQCLITGRLKHGLVRPIWLQSRAPV